MSAGSRGMEMRIRDPEPGDIPAWARLLAALDAGPWAPGKEPSEVEGVLASMLAGKTAATVIRVAEAEGKLAGGHEGR